MSILLYLPHDFTGFFPSSKTKIIDKIFTYKTGHNHFNFTPVLTKLYFMFMDSLLSLVKSVKVIIQTIYHLYTLQKL